MTELALSDLEEDQQKAKYYSQKLIQSILESENVRFGKDGKIDNVLSPIVEFWREYGWWFIGPLIISWLVTQGLYSKSQAAFLTERLDANLPEEYKDISKVENSIEITEDMIEEQTIREVSSNEKESHTKVNDILDNIINTEYDIDLSMERWDIEFVADSENITEDQIPGKLESRDQSIWLVVHIWDATNASSDYIKIDWLDMQFNNITEWMRAANLINYLKGHYVSDNDVEHFEVGTYGWLQADIKGSASDMQGMIADIEVLSWDLTDRHFNWLNDKSKCEKFVKYMNSELGLNSSESRVESGGNFISDTGKAVVGAGQQAADWTIDKGKQAVNRVADGVGGWFS